MTTLEYVFFVANGVNVILTTMILAIKPFRLWLFGLRADKNAKDDAMRCLLRSEIVKCYYKNQRQKSIHSYEFENISFLYKAYKALGGNSFIDKIWNEIQEWSIE